MFELDAKSLNRLNGVDKRLVDLAKQVAKITPIHFQITEGVRSNERQLELVRTGKSKTMNSKHLKKEDGYGHAIDIVGCYEKYNNNLDITFLSGLFYGVAAMMGIKIRVGALWDNDSINKNNFVDIYHIELLNNK